MTTLNIKNLVENAAVICHDAGIQQAIETMTAHQSDRVYLTDESGRVIRVVCDFQLLKAVIRGALASSSLLEIASPLRDRLHPDQPLLQAAVLFRSGYCTEIPVFESHQFLGVVRRKSLLAKLIDSDEIRDAERHFPSVDREARATHIESVLSGLASSKSRKIG